MKRTIWILSIAFLLTAAGLVYQIRMNQLDRDAYWDRGILTNADRVDYERMNLFYERFQAGKGDTLMLILPTIDSGPIIFDIHALGQELNWNVDFTRDAYSAKNTKRTYVCRELNKTRANGHVHFLASDCGSDVDEREILSISFPERFAR
ncbi:hypothetical protein ACF3MZ_10060 [Paenibacillaceae bacterium WGS1546]|uniref:hypothetical protein n=1 Tax=Cohnella sp. WGS1546 TaxID=3366810 RepID=UPI00372D1C17